MNDTVQVPENYKTVPLSQNLLNSLLNIVRDISFFLRDEGKSKSEEDLDSLVSILREIGYNVSTVDDHQVQVLQYQDNPQDPYKVTNLIDRIQAAITCVEIVINLSGQITGSDRGDYKFCFKQLKLLENIIVEILEGSEEYQLVILNNIDDDIPNSNSIDPETPFPKILYDRKPKYGDLPASSQYYVKFTSKEIKDIMICIRGIISSLGRSDRSYHALTRLAKGLLDPFLVKGTQLFYLLEDELEEDINQHNVVERLKLILSHNRRPGLNELNYLNNIHEAFKKSLKKFDHFVLLSNDLVNETEEGSRLTINPNDRDYSKIVELIHDGIELISHKEYTDSLYVLLVRISSKLKSLRSSLKYRGLPLYFKLINETDDESHEGYLGEGIDILLKVISDIIEAQSPFMFSLDHSIGDYIEEKHRIKLILEIIEQMDQYPKIILNDTEYKITYFVDVASNSNHDFHTTIESESHLNYTSSAVYICQECEYRYTLAYSYEHNMVPRHHGKQMRKILEVDQSVKNITRKQKVTKNLERALVLKESSSIIDKANAIAILYDLDKNPDADFIHKIHVYLAMIDIHLYELYASEDDSIVYKINDYLDKLRDLATSHQLEFLIVDVMIIESKIALGKGNLLISNKLMRDAMDYVQKMREEKYMNRVVEEHQLLKDQETEWKKTLHLNSDLINSINEEKIKSYLNKIKVLQKDNEK